MKNSNVLEKSRGILAFAFNTEATDYVKIAEQTLAVASKKLGLPYTLITDDALIKYHNTRYDIDLETFVEWKNFNRCSAYDLSPYDETLVIDVDYLILDNELLKIFETTWDYLLQRNSHALVQTWEQNMGPNSLPYVWATVFAFRKTSRAQQFFKLVERIQNNYVYYRALFNVQERNYRNDYAFAIADIILNGFQIGTTSIPGSILAINQPIHSITPVGNSFIVRDSSQAYILPCTNLHIMSKRYLQSDNFTQLVHWALNESA